MDDLNNKMDELLNTNFEICYNYSSIIMIIYKKLLAISSLNGNFLSLKDDFEELKEYILKEYEAYETLLTFDKARLIAKIDEVIKNKSLLLDALRFKNRLQSTKNILNGYEISTDELMVDNIPGNMKFDIYLSILTVMYIKLFKDIKKKLDSLSCEDESDKIFVNSLYGLLNTRMLYRCCSNDLFEIVSLFCDMDIDKLPDISIDVIKNKLIEVFYGLEIDEHINDIFFNLIVDDISKIKIIQKLKNNSTDVFEYLYITMKVNTIMSFMNKEYLQKLYDYCISVEFNNNHIHKNIKRLVKIKLDTEK